MQPGCLRTKLPLHKYLLYGWIENLDTVRHIPIGNVWGVRIAVTPIIGLSLGIFFTLGLLQNSKSSDVIYFALVYLVGVEIATLLHGFGHILGGKIVLSPMDELLFTATRGVNLYHGDQSHLPGHVHLGRALGGPVFNLLVAGVIYLLLPYVPRGLPFDVLVSLAATNLFFGLGSFLPLPSIDGWVIWREILRSLRAQFRPHPSNQ